MANMFKERLESANNGKGEWKVRTLFRRYTGPLSSLHKAVFILNSVVTFTERLRSHDCSCFFLHSHCSQSNWPWYCSFHDNFAIFCALKSPILLSLWGLWLICFSTFSYWLYQSSSCRHNVPRSGRSSKWTRRHAIKPSSSQWSHIHVWAGTSLGWTVYQGMPGQCLLERIGSVVCK